MNNTIFCQNCGHPNNINENNCSFCHQQLVKYNYVPQNNSRGNFIPNNQQTGHTTYSPYPQTQQPRNFIPNPQPNMYAQMPYHQMQQPNKGPVKTPILNFFCLLSVVISYFLRFTPLWTLSYICLLLWLIVYVVLVNHYKDSGRDISSIKTTRNTVCILFVLLFCIKFVIYI